MSWLSDFFKDDEGGMQTVSTMDPDQSQIMGSLSDFISSRIGKGLPAWQGDWTAPLGEYEEMGMDQLGKYLEGGMPESSEMALDVYKQGLQGMDPDQVYDWYTKYMAPMEARHMKRNIIPELKESFVPGGMLRSESTDRALGEAWESFGSKQLGRIGETIMGERAAARGLLPLAGAMEQLQGGLPRIEAAMTYGSIPRMIEQADLNARIQEFIRTTPELNPILQTALGAMGVQTQAAYYQPAQPNPFMQFLTGLSPALGYGLGSNLGNTTSNPTSSTTSGSGWSSMTGLGTSDYNLG